MAAAITGVKKVSVTVLSLFLSVCLIVSTSQAASTSTCQPDHYLDHGTHNCEHCCDICCQAEHRRTKEECQRLCPGFLLLWCGAQAQAQGCTGTGPDQYMNFTQEVMKCFSQQGVPQNWDIILGETRLSKDFVLSVCSDRETARKAVSCVFRLQVECYSDTPDLNATFPNPDRMIEAVDYFCDHLSETDLDCWLRYQQDAIQERRECEQSRRMYYPEYGDPPALACVQYQDMLDHCVNLGLLNCSNKTREVNFNMYDNYRRPIACGSGSRTDTGTVQPIG